MAVLLFAVMVCSQEGQAASSSVRGVGCLGLLSVLVVEHLVLVVGAEGHDVVDDDAGVGFEFGEDFDESVGLGVGVSDEDAAGVACEGGGGFDVFAEVDRVQDGVEGVGLADAVLCG